MNLNICQNIAFAAHSNKVSQFFFNNSSLSFGFSWRFSHFATIKKIRHDSAITIIFSSNFKLIEIFILVKKKKMLINRSKNTPRITTLSFERGIKRKCEKNGQRKNRKEGN